MKLKIAILLTICLTASIASAITGGGRMSGIFASYRAPQAPNAPTGVTATAGNTQNTVNWTDGTGPGDPATSYTLYGDTFAFPTTPRYTGSATSYTHTGLTNGTPYYYRLTASNAAGTSGYSSPDATAIPVPSIDFTGTDGTLPSEMTTQTTLADASSTISIKNNQLDFHLKADSNANATGWATVANPQTFNNTLTLSAKFVTLPINTSAPAADYLGLEIGTADKTSVNLQMAVYMTSPGVYGFLVIRPGGAADVSAALPGLVANEIFVLKITSPTSFSVYRGVAGTTLVGTYSMSGVTNGTTLYGRIFCHESKTTSFTDHYVDDLQFYK